LLVLLQEGVPDCEGESLPLDEATPAPVPVPEGDTVPVALGVGVAAAAAGDEEAAAGDEEAAAGEGEAGMPLDHSAHGLTPATHGTRKAGGAGGPVTGVEPVNNCSSMQFRVTSPFQKPAAPRDRFGVEA
jgi:hypothetical protein